jgi:glycine/D-amino acid oxidase-like deaminating enzyme
MERAHDLRRGRDHCRRGLAGLVAAAELAEAGKQIIIVDQEPEQSLGGQAFWSLGGIFLVNSPEQRRLGIHDSYDLALEDWMGTFLGLYLLGSRRRAGRWKIGRVMEMVSIRAKIIITLPRA